MARVIEAIRTIVPPEHPVLGKGILELVDVKSAPYPGASVVPEYCRATYDRRLLVGETKESVLAPIVALMDKLMADDPELKVKVSYAVGKENVTPEKLSKVNVSSLAGSLTRMLNLFKQSKKN